MVGVDLPEGIHHISIAVQMKYLFLCPADGELAPALDVLGVSEVEGAKAGLGEIHEEDIPPLAKVSLPHFVARLQIRGRDKLVGLRVTDCDHVSGAFFWCNQNLSGKVEVDQKQYELIQWHEVVRCNQKNMEHQNKCFLTRFVNV